MIKTTLQGIVHMPEGAKKVMLQGLRNQGSGQNPSSTPYKLCGDGHSISPVTEPVSLSVKWAH